MGGRCQRRLGEQRVGDQFGVGRQRGGALPAARPVTGENMIELARQIAQFRRRQIGGGQARLFIGIDVIGKARMRRARRQRDMGLAVPDEKDAHRYDQ